MSAYIDREQTHAKHYILRRYLQALAFKVLHGWNIAYVDGFSGPWESKMDDFSDTSFMIAIGVLKDAQQRIAKTTTRKPRIRCFFSEKDPKAYVEMVKAVMPHHDPANGFEIETSRGQFVDAVEEIRRFVGDFFPLIFIDPTGWTEYPFAKIAPLFSPTRCEVLINFMYGHISRFVQHPDEKIIASLDPILGGPGWQQRLDTSLRPGPAVEKLFRETLQSASRFAYVVSTKIDKSIQNRPHFFLAYGTKDRNGLKAFRETEFEALREHARNRSAAKTRKREIKTQTPELFATFDVDIERASIDSIVQEQKALAKDALRALLAQERSVSFTRVVDLLLQAFMVRESNVKDICVELAREGVIRNSWGAGNRKPNDETTVELVG